MISQKWSQGVAEHSDALDFGESVFTKHDPAKIAASLMHWAEYSKRRKGIALQSAMNMLPFFINRADDYVDAGQRDRPEAAKDELRHAFDRA